MLSRSLQSGLIFAEWLEYFILIRINLIHYFWTMKRVCFSKNTNEYELRIGATQGLFSRVLSGNFNTSCFQLKKYFIPFLVILFLFNTSQLWGQSKKNQLESGNNGLTDNDTMVYRILGQIDVYPNKGKGINFRNYSRMVVRIRKVYPFAKEAASELAKYNAQFENAKSDKDKRKYVKLAEKNLYAKYEDQLKKFTVTEGKYLMLLIDRETGNTSYSIIKELKGGIPAVFWQGVAKLFKNDLKEEYDPIYDHYMIEQIVLMIEAEEKAKQNKK